MDGERCRARVSLTGKFGEPIAAEAEGPASPAGRLRSVADATVEALHRHTGHSLQVEVLGIKAIRAFDNSLVVASVMVRFGDKSERVVGSCIQQAESPRGAALAVLDATNRLVAFTMLDAAQT